MTANPIELIGGLTNTSNVAKADLVAWAKARVAQVLADFTELRNTTLSAQLIVAVKANGITYIQDTTDTTTADDGVTCIVSLDGKRFKPVATLAPTLTKLGGVFQKTAVANHMLTGLDASGNLLDAALPVPSASTLGGVQSIAAVSHKWINTISTSGVPNLTQPDAADVTFTAASGTARTASSRFNDTFNVMDYGADATGAADSAAAFRTALAATPYGGTLNIPAGNFLLNSPDPATGGAGILDFSNFANKSVTIQGVGWNLKVGGVYTNPQGSILRIGASVPTTCDFLYIPMSDRVTGLRLKDLAVTAALGVFNTGHGRNGVHIDGTINVNGYVEFFEMENVFIDNMANGHSLLVQGLVAGNTMIDSVISKCTLMNSKFDYVADNITVEKCVFGANAFGTTNGPNRGIYVNQVAGATNFKMIGNNFVNQDGMIVVDCALTPIIRDCEFEQNPGANAHGSMVDLLGSIGSVVGGVITGCSITNNSTTGTIPNINLGTAVGTQIDKNTLRENAQAHIVIGSGSSRTVIGDNPSYTSSVVGDTTVTDGGTLTQNSSVWKTYTPTITASSGTFTTTTATGSYRLFGKSLSFELDIHITTVGSASGTIIATLPASLTAKHNCCVSGREFSINGFLCNVSITAAANLMSIAKYDNTSIIGAGAELVVCGCIEIA